MQIFFKKGLFVLILFYFGALESPRYFLKNKEINKFIENLKEQKLAVRKRINIKRKDKFLLLAIAQYKYIYLVKVERV